MGGECSENAETGTTFTIDVNVKVKQSRYRPGVTQRVPGS